jgi:integrating conjugative element protein (TIGR03758 family)
VTPAQAIAFEANAGYTAADASGVLVSLVFAGLLLWGVWALRTAYVGWAEERLSQRQFLGVAVRFVALYLLLTFFLLS